MIVQPDFLDHWKTQMLCDLLDDQSAPLVLIRIWSHCQNRKTHQLPTDNPSAIKAICKSDHDAQKLYDALLETGFLVHEDGFLIAHDWSDVNASLIANWENGKKGGRPRNINPTKTHGLTHPKPTVNPSITDKRREEESREENTPLTPQGGESLSVLNSVKPKRGRKKKDPVKSIYVDNPPTFDDVADLFREIIREKKLKSHGNKNGSVDRAYGTTLVENYLLSRKESEWVKFTGGIVKNWKLDFRQWVNYKIKPGELVEIGSGQ